MILHKEDCKKDKKANPFIGILLFLISILLLAITGPIGFILAVLKLLFSKGLKGLGTYALQLAISIDQLGNVLMQHLFNSLWIIKGGYLFGNRDETISSALGKNKQLGTLTGFGKAIDKLLDLIDPGHSLDSIDYYIQPTKENG
ncbi:hypothetical protein [Croceitalea rosinachiae]|uniref:Uncharacterized protein n=1 Tax=Croceitalea rosinachiae TaxID=3075596 RepID=A0ABU3AD02_9FLAO|nr:hypothetical protein [Croceitalea sp. F388]MDT0608067.1 hypothetical protein [Croceitalea sp. F388]